MERLNIAQASFIAANYAVALADATGEPVHVQWVGGSIKAMPGDKVPDILKRFDGGGPVTPPSQVDDIQLSHPSGTERLAPKWIGKPDPGYRGETKRVVPFDNFEEG